METPSHAAAQRLCVVLSGAFWWRRWRGRCWGMRKSRRKLRCNGVKPCFSPAWWRPALATLCGTMALPVDAGTLGIMNNMHVPAGLLVNFAIRHQQPHWPLSLLQARGCDPRFAVGASKWVAPRPQ